MKQFTRILCLLFLVFYILFAYQNQIRLPMKDIQGGYLSLDLYFIGFQLTQPISVAVLLGIAFLIGVIASPLIRYVFTKNENSNDFYSDDY